MDKEIKGKWVEALRSGKYKQCQGILKRNDEYCCLGVLCDIVDPEWTLTHAEESGYLPDHIKKLAGLTITGMLTGYVDGCGDLASLNDKAKYTFDQIADVIEEHF
jgi:hypothetical protein